ncbi:MAG: TonB-dependent receptor [Acidobacteria bacterium]|nr:TonB-dependent receptor [Acidobacteriota bacterium]
MKYRGVLLLVCCLALCVGSFGQINTGKITGFITDASGAVVPSVPVTAVDDATGVVTRTETSEGGEYVLNFLVPGTYRIAVEKSGFKKILQTGVIVNAGGIERVDFTLAIGNVDQVVGVEANPINVATETSELSQTFSHKELDALPNIDRNPLFQMNLIPGANNDVGSGNYGTNGGENGSAVGQTRPQLASIGGVDANANSIYIDGVPNREPQNAYISLTPGIEGVQELEVYTGKYNAEFGFSGSAVVNITTKSGSNQLHGAAFEFLRNEATDARNYFGGGEPNTPFRRNQFGGAIGGPILKNRLFFFGDYQGIRLKTSSTKFTTAPTAKMLTGDFSELYVPGQVDDAGNTFGQIYDPSTRVLDAFGNVVSATPFPGNIIPQSKWDSSAAAMNAANIFGVANLPGISNNLRYLSNNNQTTDQADGRIDFDRTSSDRIFFRYSVLDAVNLYTTNVNTFFQDANVNSNTFNQNMQVSDFHIFGATKTNEVRLAFNRSNVRTGLASQSQDYNNQFGIPNGNLSNDQATKGLAEFIMAGVPSIATPDWVGYIVSNTVSLTDNFTWTKGRHVLKFGTNINHVVDVSADTIGGDNPRGALTFSEAMTPFDGIGFNGGGNAANALAVQPVGYAAFLLGDMTASARAHFVAGAPYQSYWQNAWYAQDDFKILPSLTLNIGLRYELLSRPVERHNRQSNWDTRTNQLVVATPNDRSPALGLDPNDWGPRVGFAWTPDRGKTSIRGGYGISYWMAYWSGPLTILGLTYPNYAKQSLLTPNNLTPSLKLSTDGIPLANAVYDPNGNLLIPDNAVVRGADYNWQNQRVDQANLNIEREIRPGMVVDIGYLNVRGIHNNHSVNINQAPPTAPGTDFNLDRPLYGQYPQLGDIPISKSIASSRYDAITARFTANLAHSIYINASYAHGRSFSNGNNLDQTNINQYYGPTQEDIAHIFNAQFSWDVPVGHGRHFLNTSNRFVDAILGGWQYAALLHIRSGTRFDIVTSDGTSLNNGQTNRADRVGNGVLSSPSVNQWFDTSAFVIHSTPETYGNAGIDPLHADGQQQLDSSLSKTFHITERHQIQFRADAFNTFNHPNFAAPDNIVGDPSEGQVFSTSIDNRRMQFSLRYSF